MLHRKTLINSFEKDVANFSNYGAKLESEHYKVGKKVISRKRGL